MTTKASIERNLKAMQNDPEDARHGTTTGYRYGCRCEACREANSASHKARRRRNVMELYAYRFQLK